MAKKDSYWFKHDSTSGRGLRMRKMAFIYGHWGKGVYWDVIEILRDQSDYMFNCDELSLKMLSDLIGCKDDAKFINWFNDCINFELFKINGNSFFSEVLIENMKVWESCKSAGIQSSKKRIERNLNRGGNGTSTEVATERQHNIIEDKSIEDNIRKDINTKNQLSQWFKDLPNSIELEDIARSYGKQKEDLLLKVEEFKKYCEISYPTYAKFVFHFKNWLNKNNTQQTPTKKRNALI